MKAVKMVLIAGLVLGLMACATQAEGNKKKSKEGEMVKGTVSAVSESSITVKPVKKDAEEVTVSINEETKIKVNDKKAAAKDIQVGMKVMVRHKEGTAIAIKATDGSKKKEKPAGEPKK